MFGFRYDTYTSSDNPRYNAQFDERYGFANNANFDGIDLFQPRVGFNWIVDDSLEVRAGFGLYSGGNPNVWLSNSYSNDGLVQIGLQHRGVDLFNTPMTNGGTPGYEIPQDMFDEIQNTPIEGGDGSVNALDPNFEMPSEWKYSVGATYTTDNDIILSADLLYNQKVNSATIIDAGLQYSNETAPDGRPMYEEIAGRNSEYVLTNSGKDGSSTILSLALSKSFDYGLDISLGYSYTNSEDANPMTSAVAGSNYGNLAVTDALNPGMATSNYEIPHRFTMNLSYATEFIDGLTTRFSLFGQANEGQSYSFTYDNSDREYGDQNWNGDRQLMYIPLEDDPIVSYADDFDKAAFDAFIAAEGLTRGAISGRNSQNADWYTSFDFKINQEIPGFMDDHRGNLFFIVKNVGNMLNDDWGVMKQGQFVGNRMVGMSIEDGKYVYEDFNAGNEEQTYYKNASLWEMRVGVSYDF